MDINSLLSPSETPRASSLTPTMATPPVVPSLKHATVQRASSSTSLPLSTNSPLSRAIHPPSSIPPHVRSPLQQPAHSSPLISPVPAGTVAQLLPRTSSTQSIETLADLSSLQTHQTARVTPPIMNRGDSTDSQKSSAGPYPTLPAAAATSQPRTSFDIAMVETPNKEVLRSDYSNTSLGLDAQQRLAVLVAYIQETPSSYEAHTEIIKILHHGFVDYIYPSSDPNARRNPKSYDLLPELRRARENLDKLFAVGEEQWLDWLQDESILAETADERVAVVDKCQRALSEELGSVRLWITYGEWVLHCYKWAQDALGDPQAENLDPERLIGREVFDWKTVLDIWADAVQHTKTDMSRSHEVWNKFFRVQFGEPGTELAINDATEALSLFQTRLRVPHAQWQHTFSAFSSFVSANVPPDEYEAVMASTLKDSAMAKQIFADRDHLETAIEQAKNTGDQAAEFQAFSAYIEWERAQREISKNGKARGKRSQLAISTADFDMIAALFQRAELRFPSSLPIWEEHIEHILANSKADALPLLARATKHCPWSGSLWKQYLLTSELMEQPFDATETIKHKATQTGLLDAAGIEEALVVYDAWCGYLLRRTRRPDATEEDADVAEMGIRSSIEAVHSLASKLGMSSDFDSTFRLQRKHVEYLKSQHRLDNARAQFDEMIADYGKYYKFWLRFYDFELQKNVQMAFSHSNGADRLAAISSAPFAAAILKQGLQQSQLDFPEPLIEALINHCEDYEDAEELQSALSLARKVRKTLAVKRHQEALENPVLVTDAQAAEVQVKDDYELTNGLSIGKRKRDNDVDDVDEKTKRRRSNDDSEQPLESIDKPDQPLKRDREHASVLVRGIPANLADSKIRQFFSACGTVKSLRPLQDEDGSVVVEFEDADAANYALSRDGRDLDGSALSVTLNTGSTLYVTNYIAAADETYIRDLMSPYGDIISIRFPSLQKNKRRRFCYVDFKRPSAAQAATKLDGKEIDGLAITVKISDPSIRQPRTEQADGRELFVGHLPFKATKEDIEQAFSSFGTVEHVKLPQDPKSSSRNRGIAFITFATSDEAQAALAMHQQDILGRKITVSQATEKGPRGARSVNGRSKSPSVAVDDNDKASAKGSLQAQEESEIEDRRSRTIAISGLPDTINESRLRVLAEKFAPVRKVILKTNHQGALIEFETIADAGRASIELEGFEIIPGRKIRITTEKEMLQQQAEHKQEQFVKKATVGHALSNGPVRRPNQPGTRKGGHLGQRSNMVFASAKKEAEAATDEKPGVGKTNDDFRSLMNNKT
ncbi:hypothetical protein PV10_00182 [Exophiala mesophila]|uniref:U4/U6 snRNA-associated-splicing factor PRP24 n=1 Tax=Exophiala mesophila TaxID=212818 RepID=A0A0D1X3A3_EXOME|nr:uncharacterized protein PV10_00182 [Exophiala mesophila]KIV96300.1 hypothetical protein PV10_00182 [Exophiala mesophila]